MRTTQAFRFARVPTNEIEARLASEIGRVVNVSATGALSRCYVHGVLVTGETGHREALRRVVHSSRVNAVNAHLRNSSQTVLGVGSSGLPVCSDVLRTSVQHRIPLNRQPALRNAET